MDFELTDDGDLYLGQQQVDEEGYLLYYMVDELGDRLPIPTRDVEKASIPVRDFKTIHEDEERLQLIQTRLKTENPDWILYTRVGASLTDFIGRQNTASTGKEIEERVLRTLTRNNSFDKDELTVNLIPTSASEVLIDVKLDGQNIYLRYAFTLNFEVGVTNVYVLDRTGQIVEEEVKVNPDIMDGMPEPEEIQEDITEGEQGG